MGVAAKRPSAFFMVTGIVLLVAGVAWQLGWIQCLRLGRLPGDILIERENMRFFSIYDWSDYQRFADAGALAS